MSKEIIKNPVELFSTLGYDILGPSANSMGEWLNLRSKEGLRNIDAVLRYANGMLKARKGRANVRVAMRVLSECRYVSDTAAHLYLAGVLAASIVDNDGSDDSAISMADLVCKMSGFQMRSHYLIYESIRRAWRKHKVLSHEEDRNKCEILFGQ